jgi:hypothetical protein
VQVLVGKLVLLRSRDRNSGRQQGDGELHSECRR